MGVLKRRAKQLDRENDAQKSEAILNRLEAIADVIVSQEPPEIPAPIVNVAPPVVNYTPPEVNVPEPKVTVNVEPPEIEGLGKEVVDEMKERFTRKEPLPVQVVDDKGNPVVYDRSNPSRPIIRAGSTQYSDGSGQGESSLTGNVVMWKDTDGNARAVSAAKPLPVDIQDASVVVSFGALDPKYGSVSGVAQLATATVSTYTASAGEGLFGFSATGNREGLLRLKINGVVKLSGRVALGQENCINYMPASKTLSASDVILLEVTNEGQGTGSFEGSILIKT